MKILWVGADLSGAVIGRELAEAGRDRRITEHKHFCPWENHEGTVFYREFSRTAETGGTPYYQIRLVEEKALLEQYIRLARATPGVTFVGRLGTYRYLDMDVTIRDALNTAFCFIECAKTKEKSPAFVFLS